jgi:hypothetical protein
MQKLLENIEYTDYCWNWKLSVGSHGYGQINVGGKILSTHRLMYEIKVGPIPEGYHILHKCDNKRCCNPEHLSPGTRSDNMRDMCNKGRKRGSHITHEMAKIIRRAIEIGMSRKELSEIFEVTPNTIGNIRDFKYHYKGEY